MSSWTSATVWAPDDIASMTPDQWAARWPDVVRRLLGGEPTLPSRTAPKLSLEAARVIRVEYAAGDVTQRTLARCYGVTDTTINLIVAGRLYAERYGRVD